MLCTASAKTHWAHRRGLVTTCSSRGSPLQSAGRSRQHGIRDTGPARTHAGRASRPPAHPDDVAQRGQPAWTCWALLNAGLGRAAACAAAAVVAAVSLQLAPALPAAHAALPAYSELASSEAAHREQGLFTDDAWQGMRKLSEYSEYVGSLEDTEAHPGCELCAHNRALLERAWQTVANEFYDPTARFSQSWWAGQLQATLQESGGALHSAQELDIALERLMQRLGDKYSAYLRPADFRRALRRPLPSERNYYQAMFVGVGLQLGEVAPGGVGRVVEAPLAGSPAEAAGLMRGDVVLDIDGMPLEALSATEVAGLMRGPAGSSVTLTWQSSSNDASSSNSSSRGHSSGSDQRSSSSSSSRGQEEVLHVAVLERKELPQPAVREARLALLPTASGGNSMRAAALQPGAAFVDEVSYLRVYYVGGETSQQIAAALARGEQDGVAGYILDLRNNPGGVFEEAIATAALLLDPGQQVAATVRNEEVIDASFVVGELSPEIFDTLPLLRATAGGGASVRGALTTRPLAPGELVGGVQGAVSHAPVVVLVNGNSASAAEVLAGALRDNHRALLIGVDTFGKGLVQWYFPLSGSRLVQEHGAGGRARAVSLPSPLEQQDSAGGLKVTVAKYLTPAGWDISRQGGLRPDRLCRDHPREWQHVGAPHAQDPMQSAGWSTAAGGIAAAPAAAHAQVGTAAGEAQAWEQSLPRDLAQRDAGARDASAGGGVQLAHWAWWRGGGPQAQVPGMDDCIRMGLRHIQQVVQQQQQQP